MRSEDTAKNNVLVVTICSYHKNEHAIDDVHETSQYSLEKSIVRDLKPSTVDLLFTKRKNVYDLLRAGNIFWHNFDENQHPNNATLVPGADFGQAPHPSAKYIPALYRYHGRFYKELKENGRNNLMDPTLHVLILSGLYGFVFPEEPIQNYSVPIEWGSNVQKVWTEKNALTTILLDYITKNQIEYVYDFTARQDYRETINWSLVHPIAKVRHVFSKRGAGNDALEDFAIFLREQAPGKVQHSLMSLDFDRDPSHNQDDDLYTRSVQEEWDGFPKERKSIPLEKGVLNLDGIPDYTTRQVFMTAEQMLKVIYNLESVGDDAGSIFFVLYGKGFEVMLENAITKKIRALIHKNDPKGALLKPRYLSNYWINTLDHEAPQSIALGSWNELTKEFSDCNHSVSRMVLQWINTTYGAQFSVITRAAAKIAKMRNPRAHIEIQTIEDFLNERKRIIDQINEVIPILYPPQSR